MLQQTGIKCRCISDDVSVRQQMSKCREHLHLQRASKAASSTGCSNLRQETLIHPSQASTCRQSVTGTGYSPSTSVSPVSTIPPMLHIHSSIYHRLYVTLATGSVVKYPLQLRSFAVGWDTALQAGRSRVRFPMVIVIFHWHNPSGPTIALGSTQSLTEMSTRSISWGVKAAGA